MTRTIPAAIQTALAAGNVEVFTAVEFLFDSGPLRLWTGTGSRTINGQTYQGAGSLLAINEIVEVNDLSAKSATVALSGLSPEIISYALGESYQNRIARIYFGVASVSPVVTLFSGFIDTMEISDSGETCVVTVTIESKLIELEKTVGRRYTQASHQTQYPGDTFFNYVAGLADRTILFGREE